MKKKQRIYFLAVFVFFTFFLNLPVHALVISPAIKRLYVKPGDQIVEVITVANEENKEITLFPVVENFKPKDAKGTPEFLGDTDPEGAARWIQLPFRKITLGPEERKDFLFKINIPQWARPGGHYAALFWNSENYKKSELASVSRVGSLFLFGVAGNITGEIHMSELSVVNNKNGGVDGFSISIENKSSIHVAPKGTIEIYNFFGRRVAEFPLNTEEKNVLAQSRRIFFEKWKGPYFSWGRMRARVKSEFGFNFPAEEKDVVFYNLPRFAGIKIFIVFALIIFGIIKMYRKKRLKKEHSLIFDP